MSIPGTNSPSAPLARQRALTASWWCMLATLLAVPVVLRSLVEMGGLSAAPATIVVVSLGGIVIAASVLAATWPAIVRRIGNHGLAVIALVAAMLFAVRYVSMLAGYVIGALLGPFYVFLDGVGSKGLACLLLGMLVVLLPHPGVLALCLGTVFLLSAVTTGQLGAVALLFAVVSMATHEGFAAALGVTTGRMRGGDERHRQSNGAHAPSLIARVGLAIGLANAAALYGQYALTYLLLRLHFDLWYVHAVSLTTGLLYGGIGAACGAALGLRLRKTAP